ncbi:hypothetical protein F2P81_005852 [Scophthalmus maximus]|uniref:PH domain-containing protein n=1 Tax=Scophthalmus maximus TaxID=52904 RepID=A0A6A4TEY1_SCOMX|nr:hypothetical protein F2P81_005852 [Scophthalmus maximus]
MARRTGRQRSQLPTCYYEGYLEKRSFKDKTSRKLWTCLCGNMLFFFNEKRDADYIEKVDLRGMISVTDDSSLDRNLDAARIILKMQDGNIKFTAPNTEARELWKGYILSVSELSVPPSLNLLPGQFHMLQEAVDKETERLKHVDPPEVTSSPYINLQVNFPPAIFSHYRVTGKQEGGFSIDVDNPVPCATLSDVINHLVEKTDGALVPLIIEEEYEKNIFFIRSDNENGEKSVEQALSNPRRSLPPKPDTLKIKTPVRAPTPVEEQKKPPVPAPRKFTLSTSTHSATSSTNRDLRSRSHTDPLGQTISELKLKFGQKAKCPE